MSIPLKTIIGATLASMCMYYCGYLAWQGVFG